MRRLIPLAGLIVLAATAPSARAATVGCSQQAEARFRNVFHEERSVHVGPLALSGARDIATIDRGLLERLGGVKTPPVLRPGGGGPTPGGGGGARPGGGGGGRSDGRPAAPPPPGNV